MRAGNRPPLCSMALALLAIATVARADYKDDYAHGIKAFRDGQYAEARKLVQQALDEHAEPAVKIRLYGQVYEPYLPQHYVGMAAFKLGDCATALSQWNSPANRQIAAMLPEISGEEQRNATTCAPKRTENPPPKTVIADNPTPKPVVPPPKPPEPVVKPVSPIVEKPPVEKPVVVKTTPPEPLVQAFDNYLAGRYAEVARINPDAYADTRSRFHAYLVRAASRYTLSRISGDEQMLKNAGADAAAARTLEPRIAPDATLFSPAFRTFFQQGH